MDYQNFYNQTYISDEYASMEQSDPSHKDALLECKKKICKKQTNPKALEIGSGRGIYQNIFEDYVGVDISENLKKNYKKKFVVIRDGEKYPFPSETFDFIFTINVFEHIPNIQFSMREMSRVLKKGGVLFFYPAWLCVSWAAEGFEVRPYSDFNLLGKMTKLSLWLRKRFFFKALHVMPYRIFHLILFLFGVNYQDRLRVKKIKANYEIYWQADSDACNRMDPFLAILYFRENGFKILSHPNLWRQVFASYKPVLVEKI